MTATELRNFLNEYPSSFSYSTSLEIYKDQNQNYQFKNNGILLGDNDIVDFCLNDYISNVYSEYFPESRYTYELTTADYIIEYIRDNHVGNINYQDCFRRETTLSILPISKVSELFIQNPVDDFLILNSQLDGKLTIFDMFGRAIANFKKEEDMYVGNLPSGFYIAQLQSDKKNISKKFVKN